MHAQEQQVIESLFARIQQAAQAGPRDAGAEALVQEPLHTFPAAPYSMAQTLVLQERALQRADMVALARDRSKTGPGRHRSAAAPVTQAAANSVLTFIGAALAGCPAAGLGRI